MAPDTFPSWGFNPHTPSLPTILCSRLIPPQGWLLPQPNPAESSLPGHPVQESPPEQEPRLDGASRGAAAAFPANDLTVMIARHRLAVRGREPWEDAAVSGEQLNAERAARGCLGVAAQLLPPDLVLLRGRRPLGVAAVSAHQGPQAICRPARPTQGRIIPAIGERLPAEDLASRPQDARAGGF